MNIQIEEQWHLALKNEFEKAYFQNLIHILKQEKAAQKTIYPAGKHIFEAYRLTPFDQVNVVLLGQDPYHGAGQAHGLCFSVLPGVKPPPSLVNIFKELKSDLGIETPTAYGFLEKWAQQGMLMINAALTVVEAQPMSHAKIGWEEFTNATIKTISEQKTGVIFVLWGRFAQNKKSLIDTSKHFIIESAHPSPLSAHNGFWGSKPFSKINAILLQQGKKPIDWQL